MKVVCAYQIAPNLAYKWAVENLAHLKGSAILGGLS